MIRIQELVNKKIMLVIQHCHTPSSLPFSSINKVGRESSAESVHNDEQIVVTLELCEGSLLDLGQARQ